MLCCAHKIKNIVYDVHTCFGKKSVEGRLLIEVIIALVDLDDYHKKKLIFLHLAVLLKNKCCSSAVSESITSLKEIIVDKNCTELEKVLEENDEEIEDSNERAFKASKKIDTESLYLKSPFYKDILGIIENVDVRAEISTDLNLFFSPKLLIIVMKKHCPYLFLWTGLINSGKRYSNNCC